MGWHQEGHPQTTDDQDTPNSLGLAACFPRAAGPQGPLPSPTPCPEPCAGMGPRWWHGGGHREGVPPSAGSGVGSLCNVNCSRRQRVMHRGRRALTPAADTRYPELPAPANTGLSTARYRRHPPSTAQRRQPIVPPKPPKSQRLRVTSMGSQIPPPRRGEPPGAGGDEDDAVLVKEKPRPPAVCPQPFGALITILLITRPCPPLAPDPLVRRSPQITDVEIGP